MRCPGCHLSTLGSSYTGLRNGWLSLLRFGRSNGARLLLRWFDFGRSNGMGCCSVGLAGTGVVMPDLGRGFSIEPTGVEAEVLTEGRPTGWALITGG